MIEIDDDIYKEFVLLFYVLCIAGAFGAMHQLYMFMYIYMEVLYIYMNVLIDLMIVTTFVMILRDIFFDKNEIDDIKYIHILIRSSNHHIIRSSNHHIIRSSNTSICTWKSAILYFSQSRSASARC
jgi:hypothetical protein